MACVTEVYDYAAPRGRIAFPAGFIGFLRSGVVAATTLAVGGLAVAGTLGALGTVMSALTPAAPVAHRIPLAAPQALALVDQARQPGRLVKQSFISAYTADAAYSNLDWRRNKPAVVVADIGPDSVIDASVVMAALVEPRAERVAPPAQPAPALVASAAAVNLPKKPEAVLAAYAEAPSAPPATLAFAKITPLSHAEEEDAGPALPDGAAAPVPQAAPGQKAVAEDVAIPDILQPEDVPLPGSKPAPRFAQPAREKAATQLAYAPASGTTDTPSPGLFSPLLNQASRSRIAIYDISAATVYLPNGERLEAHSGIGHMRDNPRYVNQKNRGPTPPHSYDLRLREARFHGVEAIRLTPSSGGNLYGRDGLLAHTFMLGRSGDSNGCVVFRDYARFLRAFKRGEVTRLVVVPHMQSRPSRLASLF